MQARITDRLIASLVPSEKTYEVADIEVKGFCLIVRPTGVISFCYRYRNAEGVKKSFTLAKYGSITVSEARKQAERRAAEVKIGADIQAVRKAVRATADQARKQTLNAFFEHHYKPFLAHQMKSGDTIGQMLESQFVGRWGDISLTALTPSLVKDWQNERLKKGLKPASVNRPLTYLRAMLNRAVEWGVIESSPLAKIKKLNEDEGAKNRYLKENEETNLIQALEARQELQRAKRSRYIDWCRKRHVPSPAPHDGRFVDYLYPLVLLALHTGMRRGEIFNLRWGDVDFKVRSVAVLHALGAKSNDTRHIPLNEKAIEALSAWSEQSDCEPTNLIFPSPITGERMDNIKSAWQSLMKAAQIKNFRFHDLRHTFASKLAMRGVDLYTISELLGHSSIEMTQRYAHLSPDHKAAAVALLNQ